MIRFIVLQPMVADSLQPAQRAGFDNLHLLSERFQANFGNQAPFPGDDHQELEEVFFLRSAGELAHVSHFHLTASPS